MTPFEFTGNGDVSILERDEQIETHMYKYTNRLPKYKFEIFFFLVIMLNYQKNNFDL